MTHCSPTPLCDQQNNLNEYYTMICWVRGNLLGSPSEFKEEFVNTIEAGGCWPESYARRFADPAADPGAPCILFVVAIEASGWVPLES